MKVKRIVTPRAISRFKFMTGAFFACILVQYIAGMVQATFTLNGQEYTQYEKRVTPYGYVEEFTNNDIFCQR